MRTLRRKAVLVVTACHGGGESDGRHVGAVKVLPGRAEEPEPDWHLHHRDGLPQRISATCEARSKNKSERPRETSVRTENAGTWPSSADAAEMALL